MTAGIYTRVSSPGQATADAASLGEQERIARAICEREGWEVAEHYEDSGLSATSDTLDNRPALRRMLADARLGRFSYVVCYAQDRLARNMFAWNMIGAELKGAGVQVHTKDGRVDFGDDMDLLVSQLYAWKAKREADDIRARCDNGRRGYAERGDFPVWMEPFGYRWVEGELRRGVPNRLEPVPDELATVRLAFELADKQGLTVRKVTAELNRRGLHPRGGGRWYPAHIGKMLADPRYKGVWRVWREGEKEYFARADLVPELAATPERWARVQAVRAHHRNQTKRDLKHAFLLNGVLHCGSCGLPMVGRLVTDGNGLSPLRYYQCTARKTTNKGQGNEGTVCRGKYVPAEPLEAEVEALLEELGENPDACRAYAEKTREDVLPSLREERERLDGRLVGLVRKLDRYIRLRADEEITEEELARHRKIIDADRDAWEQRLAEIEPRIEGAELSAHAATAVAAQVGQAEVPFADMDIQAKRWFLRQLDFRMVLNSPDWTVRGPKRQYEVTIRWAGQALLGESTTSSYVGSSKARAM